MTATSVDLFATFIHLRHGGEVRAEQSVFDPERDGRQLMAFRVETDAEQGGPVPGGYGRPVPGR